jgi:hypothetical protein
VFGCADLQVAPFAWYKRDGDHATVGCEGQDVRWELRCLGSQWEGVVGNCTPNSKYTTMVQFHGRGLTLNLLRHLSDNRLQCYNLSLAAMKPDPSNNYTLFDAN